MQRLVRFVNGFPPILCSSILLGIISLLNLTAFSFADSPSPTQTVTEEDVPPEAVLYRHIQLAEKEKDVTQLEHLYTLLVTKYPTPNNFRKAGIFFGEQGKQDEAALYLKQSLQDINKDYNTLQQLFYRYRLYHQWIEVQKEWYRQGVGDPSLLTQRLLVSLISMQQYPEALEFIETHFFESIDFPGFFSRQLGSIAQEAGYTEQVLALMDRLSSNDQASKEVLLLLNKAKAELFLYRQEFEKAIPFYTSMINDPKVSDQLFLTLIQQLIETHRDRLAEELIVACLSVEWRGKHYYFGPTYRIHLSKLYERQGKVDQAIEMLLACLTQDQPQLAYKIQFELAMIYFRQKNYPEALNHFKRCGTYESDSVDTYILMIHLIQEDYVALNALLNRTWKQADVLYYKALACLFQKKVPECMTVLEQIVDLPKPAECTPKALELYRVLPLIQANDAMVSTLIQFHKALLKKDTGYLSLRITDWLNGPVASLRAYYQTQLIQLYQQTQEWNHLEVLGLHLVQAEDGFQRQQGLFILGKLYLEQKNRQEDGKRMLMDLLRQYPNSLFGSDARTLLQSIIDPTKS